LAAETTNCFRRFVSHSGLGRRASSGAAAEAQAKFLRGCARGSENLMPQTAFIRMNRQSGKNFSTVAKGYATNGKSRLHRA
jgi:hypothetical protein